MSPCRLLCQERAASRGCGPRGTSVAAEAPEQPRRQEPDEPAVRRRRAIDLDERRAALLEGEPLACAADEVVRGDARRRAHARRAATSASSPCAVRSRRRSSEWPSGEPGILDRRVMSPQASAAICAVSSARGSGLVKSASGPAGCARGPRAAFLNRLRPRGVRGDRRPHRCAGRSPAGTAIMGTCCVADAAGGRADQRVTRDEEPHGHRHTTTRRAARSTRDAARIRSIAPRPSVSQKMFPVRSRAKCRGSAAR